MEPTKSLPEQKTSPQSKYSNNVVSGSYATGPAFSKGVPDQEKTTESWSSFSDGY